MPALAPLRSVRDSHRRAAAELGVGARQDMERLLSEVQQLLVGIAIMQARARIPLAVMVRSCCSGDWVMEGCLGLAEGTPGVLHG